MSKFKKVLLMGTAYVLVAALAISGTIAYLQDSDSDVNVMTLGNVSIAQHEYERVENADGTYEMVTSPTYGEGYKLQDFEQNKPLYPATGDVIGGGSPVYFDQLDEGADGEYSVLNGINNVVDKFVFVENTGTSDAYVRTLIAYEIGSLTSAEWKNLIVTTGFDAYTTQEVGVIDINGNNYYVIEYVYAGNSTRHENGVLPAGEFTYNSLAQIYLENVATNEDCEALDGNNNGKYDVLVFSQAVQTNGFKDAQTALDTAFGDITTTNHPWTMPTEIKDADDLNEAINIPNSVVKVEEDIVNDTTISESITTTIDLQDNKLEGVLENHGTADISNGTIVGDYVQNEGEATFTDITMNTGTPSDYSNIARGEDAVTVYNDVTIVSGGGGIAAAGGAKVEFNSGSIEVNSKSTSGRYLFYTTDAGSEIVINGGDFSFSSTLNQKRAYVYANAGTTVIINDGNFGPASTRSGYTAGILGEGSVIIKGGTFGFDPTSWVAEGYEAVQSGDTWTVVAK